MLGAQNHGEVDKPEGFQLRPLRWWGLVYLPCEEWLGELGLFSLEQRWLWEDLTAAPSAYGEVLEETEVGSSQWCSMGGQETAGVSWNSRYSDWVFFPIRTVRQRHSLPREATCLPSLPLEVSNPNWVKPWATWPDWPDNSWGLSQFESLADSGPANIKQLLIPWWHFC